MTTGKPGTTKCEGNGVSVCADNGAGWLPSVFCPAGTKCQAGQCIPTSGCGDIPNVGCCDGTVFMLCSDDGAIALQECGPQGCGWIPNWGYGCGGSGADPSGQFPLVCPGSCEPECINALGQMKECGPDGCGDVCGFCPADSVCNDGLCEPFCLPQCQGKGTGDAGINLAEIHRRHSHRHCAREWRRTCPRWPGRRRLSPGRTFYPGVQRSCS